MHVRSDNSGLVFMHHVSVNCLADVSEESDISSLGFGERINQPTNYRTIGGVWNESRYYLISKHLLWFVTQNILGSRRGLFLPYTVYSTPFILARNGQHFLCLYCWVRETLCLH